ncbi:KCC1 [Enterospora canceri]|uniref:KCC1 n=1 Tax=Enterospora canceri TaxID=1081671 RepID=A0A1Y1S5U4_9MICR|nr:KCC1 [Enterospora canceri]
MFIRIILASPFVEESTRLSQSQMNLMNRSNLRVYTAKAIQYVMRETDISKMAVLADNYNLSSMDWEHKGNARILVRNDGIKRYLVKMKFEIAMGIQCESVNEIEKFKQLKHENIAKVYTSVTARNKIRLFGTQRPVDVVNCVMVMEYLDVDTEEIQGNVKMIRKMLKDVLCALEYMHRFKTANLDIRPMNIKGIRKGNEITWKLFDMESAVYLYRDGLMKSMYVYAPMYTDVLNKYDVSFAADIFQVGMTAWSLMMTDNERQARLAESIQEKFTGFEMDFNASIPEKMRSFIKEATNKDPKKRPTAEELLSHPFLTEDD